MGIETSKRIRLSCKDFERLVKPKVMKFAIKLNEEA